MPASNARASVKLVLRKQKARADGTAPIYVRVTANRKSRYVATGVYVLPKEWNANRQEVRASHDIAPTLNDKLRKLFNEALTAALDAPSADAVKTELTGVGGSLTAYFERFIEGLDASGQLWEWKKYRVTLGKLRACLGDEVDWAEVDRAALTKFERHLRQTRKNSPNTVRKELTRLRRIFKQAIRDGEIRPSDDPFLVYQKPKGQRVDRRKLTLEEIQKLSALDAEKGLVPGSFDAVARDAFVFAFYAGGMRFGDVALLKSGDIANGRANYRMMKTATPMSVPLPPPAIEIVRRYEGEAAERGGYLFPLLEKGDERDAVHVRRRISSRNAQVNVALKRVANLAEIEDEGLSMHVARHSFADFARRRSGDLYAVSKTLGHGNLKTTQDYLASLDRDAVDKLADDLWT